MRINTNIAALNAWRNLSNSNLKTERSLERLSSGLRINRAADDAAGLAVSERMMAQIRGINQAVRNTQDGMSLIQTAEGSAAEIQNMLQRMRELAVQARSGTLDDEDRSQLAQEFTELQTEIDRTANTTNFNGIDLLKGAGISAKSGWGVGTGKSGLTLTDWSATAATYTVTTGTAANTGVATVAAGNTGVTASNNGDDTVTQDRHLRIVFAADGLTYTMTDTISGEVLAEDETAADGANNVVVDGVTYDMTFAVAATRQGTTNYVTLTAQRYTATIGGDTVTFSAGDSNVTVDDGAGNSFTFRAAADHADIDTAVNPTVTVTGSEQTSISLHVGPGSSDTISVSIDGLTQNVLGIGSLSISSVANAASAIESIDDALESVSSARANLGAMQNRLETTVSTLQIRAENLTAANSRIRDVDMALEMAEFTKQQILIQAGTAMLAQANQTQQQVLSLLR